MDQRCDLVPERRGIGIVAMEKSREGIVRRSLRHVRLHPFGFQRRYDNRSRNEKLDVSFVIDAGIVHADESNPSQYLAQYQNPPTA